MADLGEPSSYEVLENGTPVYSCDGQQIGNVSHVLAALEEDIFDGIVIDTGLGSHRFADGAQVEEIFERGVLLKLDKAGCDALPEPSENPAAMEVEPGDVVDKKHHDKLRRAWDLISGNY
jgi:uncharacterized protein YrrD